MIDIYDYLESKFDVTPASEPLVRINCPFCMDSKQRLYVSVRTGDKPRGWMFCHNEQKKYDFVELFSMMENISFAQASQEIYTVVTEPHYGKISELLEALMTKQEILEEKPITSEIKLPNFFKPLYSISDTKFQLLHNQYLKSRGVTKELCEKFKLGVTGKDVGRWSDRLIIPIYQEGKLIAYQGRAMYPCKEQKYIFNKGVKIGNFLFNLDNVIEDDILLIVEGVFDVWSVLNTGFKNVVATFGKHLTEECQNKITNRFKHLYILWDSDAKTEICELCDRLDGIINTYICTLNGKDPGESTPLEIAQSMIDAKKYNRFVKMQMLLGDLTK